MAMKRRAVTTTLRPATSQAWINCAGPTVKLSIAGTRPVAWRAAKRAAVPTALGISTPTADPRGATRASFGPSTLAASTSRS